MDLGLAGKRAIVTGATRGIGRGIAEQLLQEGVSVAFCARDAAAVAAALPELAAIGPKVTGTAVDVADAARLKSWVDEAAAELGGIDIFVSSVSVGNGPGKWDAAFQTDLMGTVHGCEAVIPHIEQAGGGAIVMISTTAAFEVWNGANAYGVFKAGLMNYAKNLADIVGPKQIRVVNVAPGPVSFEGGAWPTIKQNNPAFYDKVLGSIPLGRMGAPADIARAVAFLASDAASFITGVTLTADGGRTRAVDY